MQGLVLDVSELEYEPLDTLPAAVTLTGIPPVWLALDEGATPPYPTNPFMPSSTCSLLEHVGAASATCPEPWWAAFTIACLCSIAASGVLMLGQAATTCPGLKLFQRAQ